MNLNVIKKFIIVWYKMQIDAILVLNNSYQIQMVNVLLLFLIV